MYVCLCVSKNILFRVVQVLMFDVAYVPPPRPHPNVLFPSHADDVKVDVWIVFFTATITSTIPSLMY